MTYLSGSTGVITIDDSVRPELSYAQSNQLNSCKVFADPTDIIKKHPQVLDFYNGKSDDLDFKALIDYCHAIDSTCKIRNETLGSGLAIGQHILWGLPQEKKKTTWLSQIFTKKNASPPLNSSDRDIIRDFLQAVLEMPKAKIVHKAKPQPS